MDTPQERKTPLTDAATMSLHGKRLATGGWWVEADFARDLERHLAERTEENERLHKALSNASAIYDAAREQRNRLAEALVKAEIGLCNCNPLPSFDMTTLYVVRAAIAAVKGDKQ